MNQVIMSDGSFSRVIKAYDSKNYYELELGINRLVNRNDYLGLL